MARWFEVQLPMGLAWYGDPNYWVDRLIDVYQDRDRGAYMHPVGLEAFRVRHTLFGLVLDMVGVIIDRNRDRVLLAAFPSYIGPTVGGVVALGEHGDPALRDRVAAEEQRLAEQAHVSRMTLIGPDNANWTVYAAEPEIAAHTFFGEDGRSLSPAGATTVSRFLLGVATAAGEWTFHRSEDRDAAANLEVEVTRESAVEAG